jgi:hypothetical protein
MKKKLFAVYYAGSLGLAMQLVKAQTPIEARLKFLKKNPKLSEAITDAYPEEIEPTHNHYRTFRNHAI